MAWLFMPILRSGLRTFNESAEERGDRGSSISADSLCGARTRCGKQILIGRSFIVQWLCETGKGWRGGQGKFRKPLAARRIFLPVLVESSWKKKGLSIQSFPTAGARISSRFTWSGFERGDGRPSGLRHQRVFGFSQFLRICTYRAEMCRVFCYERSTKRIEVLGKVQLFGIRPSRI